MNPYDTRQRDNEKNDAQPEKVDDEEKATRAIELYRRGGLTQTQVARLVGVNQKTVSRYIKRAREEWLARRGAAANELIQESLQRCEAIIAEAWTGWERSLTDETSRTETTVEGAEEVAEKQPKRKTVTVADGRGDPRFLAVIAEQNKERAKIMGLYPKQSIDVNLRDEREALSVLSQLGIVVKGEVINSGQD